MAEDVKKEEITNDTISVFEETEEDERVSEAEMETGAETPVDDDEKEVEDVTDEVYSTGVEVSEASSEEELISAPTHPEDDEEIVVEDISKMDDSVAESVDIDYDETLKKFEEGEILRGLVIKVDSEEVIVDVGYKSEGCIPIAEFDMLPDGIPDVRVGDSIAVYLVRKEDSDGLIVLSKKIADQKLIWNEIDTASREGKSITGKVTRRIKGGLEVNVGNIICFLPASQVELRPIQNFNKYIGKTLEMKVISLDKPRRNIVLSRRALLEEEMEARKRELLLSLEKGQMREGTVKNITQFGAFVDLGGVDGLLHKTDMSWGRVNHPSEAVSVGDKIEIMILDVDPEEERISLGLKQKTPDPWLSVEEKYPVDSTVSGKITNVVDYGAFVELEEGMEGLVHVSEMSWTQRMVHPSKIVKEGDIIEARVLDVNAEKQKISLGLKQLQPNPWELLETKYPVGSKIRGKVRNLTDFGAFVEIEKGIDGLVHISDMSWAKRFVNPREIVNEGDEVEVVVLSVDVENQKISLGLKQVEPDPWVQVPEKYKVGSVVRGEIVNLTNFGAFAKLEDGVEGLIHISELDEKHVETPEDVLSEGDVLDLKVINLDPYERRIGLSLRAYKADQDRTSIGRASNGRATDSAPPDRRDSDRRDSGRRDARRDSDRRPPEEEQGRMGTSLGELIQEAQEEYQNKQEPDSNVEISSQ